MVKEKTPHYKRPKVNDRDSEDDQRINKVRNMNKKFASNINERIIRSNIKRASNSEYSREERDPNGLAYMSNFDDTHRNTSFQKENRTAPEDTERVHYTYKENRDHNEYIAKNTLKANKMKMQLAIVTTDHV